MAATPTGEVGPSVTSLVVVDTGRGHVPVPILYPSMAGSTARILGTRCSLVCVIQGPVHVSGIKDSLRCRFFENLWETQPSSSWKIFLYFFYSWQSGKNLRTHQRSFWVIKKWHYYFGIYFVWMVELKWPFKGRLHFCPSHFHFLMWLTLIKFHFTVLILFTFSVLDYFYLCRDLIIHVLLSLFRTWWLVGLVSVVSL